MCRLAGCIFLEGDFDRNYTEIRLKLGYLLLHGECLQGGDGNGIALFTKQDRMEVYKSPRQVGDEYKEILDFLREDRLAKARYVMMHTRWATHGSSQKEINLHPFFFKHVTGAHNGVISDYKSYWTKYKKQIGEPKSENDSEIIFAMLDSFAPKLYGVKVKEVIDSISGNLAITAFSKDTPDSFVMVSRENPLSYYHDKENGIVWYGSVSGMLVDSGICIQSNDCVSLRDEVIVWDRVKHSFSKSFLKAKIAYASASPTVYLPKETETKNHGTEKNECTTTNQGESIHTQEVIVTETPTSSGEVVTGDEMFMDEACCEMCDGTGLIDEEEYIMTFPGTYGAVDWYEDEFDSLVTPCIFCMAFEEKRKDMRIFPVKAYNM